MKMATYAFVLAEYVLMYAGLSDSGWHTIKKENKLHTYGPKVHSIYINWINALTLCTKYVLYCFKEINCI